MKKFLHKCVSPVRQLARSCWRQPKPTPVPRVHLPNASAHDGVRAARQQVEFKLVMDALDAATQVRGFRHARVHQDPSLHDALTAIEMATIRDMQRILRPPADD